MDIISPSTHRIEVYQKLGVPEVWRYIQKQGLMIYPLQPDQQYQASATSRACPQLTTQKINQLIRDRQNQRKNGVIRTFRS